LSRNPVYHARTKHIDIQHHYVRELVKERTINLIYIPTADQLADVLTKPLPRLQFAELIERLGVKDVEKGRMCN